MKNSGFSSQPVSVCHAAAWAEVGGCLRSFGAPFCPARRPRSLAVALHPLMCKLATVAPMVETLEQCAMHGVMKKQIVLLAPVHKCTRLVYSVTISIQMQTWTSHCHHEKRSVDFQSFVMWVVYIYCVLPLS